MRTNVKPASPLSTHEGAPATRLTPEQQLRRSLMSCLLWEDGFYEDGAAIADRLAALVGLVAPASAAAMAVEAREKMNLRHAPLWIVRQMARHPSHRPFVADTLERIIQRADELTEFVSLYWLDGRQPLSKQVKKGLAAAFTKFDEYALAKYNRRGKVRLRDVLFLCHARPKDSRQEELWKRLVDGKLQTPDTWEVALSAGMDKKEAWERLLTDKKLGALALLRNLRNMKETGVNERLIFTALEEAHAERVLPFRFIAASRFAPQWEGRIENIMLKCLEGRSKLMGKTVLLVDVSSSMEEKLSARSDLTRMDAACGLAILARELCEKVEIYSFSMKLVHIPSRRGFSLRDAIVSSQQHQGTPLGLAVQSIYEPRKFKVRTQKFGGYGERNVDFAGQDLKPDRLIVITDEQSADAVPPPKSGRGYMINVASNRNGVGYGEWTHIDGWSEAVFDYLSTCESENTV